MQTFSVHTIDLQRRRSAKAWRHSYFLWLAIAVLASLGAASGVSAGTSFALWSLITGALVTLVRPVVGVYIITFFAIAGDSVTIIWYPFYKNLSSPESLLFLDRHLAVSPLECFLVLTMIAWIVHLVGRRATFVRGSLLVPVLVFSGFVLLGILRTASGGANRNVALWEARTLVYAPIVYVLATNLFTRKEHYNTLFWLICAAIFVDSLFAIGYFITLSGTAKDALESLGEHSASLHADLLFVLLLAVWLLPNASKSRRFGLLAMAVPVFIVYFIAHRRAAFVVLGVGLVLLAVSLYRTRRRYFWSIVPVVSLVALGYLGAFWNSQGSVGFPAQSVKSVVSPGQVSERDRSSDLYRIVETADVVATIRAAPLVGIGFGQPFYRPYPLPNLSFWVFSDFITHNGILWVWMKLGVGGFVAMLYLFAAAIRDGGRAVLRLPRNDYAAITIGATGFVMMYAIFAYVDIGWDSQSTVCLGAAFAVIANIERLHGLRAPQHRVRRSVHPRT